MTPLTEEILTMSPLFLFHKSDNARLGRVEHAVEVGINHLVPVLTGHHHQRFVDDDAGVINQNINAAKIFFDLRDPLLNRPQSP